MRQVCTKPKIGSLITRSFTNCVTEQDAVRQSDAVTDASPPRASDNHMRGVLIV